MKSILAFRRSLTAVTLFAAFLLAAPKAFATHLRGGTLSWKVTATTATTYTVQFTLTESQRWSYPNNPGTCTAPVAGSTTACAPVNTAVALVAYSGTGSFAFGDGTTADPTGTITSINQAQDYATVTFTFSHAYTISGGPRTAVFSATNRISTLKLGSDEPENISAYVQNYPNASPVASMPAILSVPLQNTVTFDLASAVTDIDPNANLVFRLATVPEMYDESEIACPSGIEYTQAGVAAGNPPGFTVSAAGIVTWDTTKIAPAITGSSCKFGTPAAGDLWSAQVMVEAHDKTTNALITQVPVDIMMQFVSAVGALPTITLNPAGTQTLNVNSPVAFTATGNSTNVGAKVTLNASGVPAGASVTGLNATVTPPAASNFSWTPSGAQAGTYVVTYTVTDSNLQQAQASKTLVVATLPTISCSTGINLTYGSTGALTATVYDPSNEVLNVVWTVDDSTVQTDSNIVAFPTAAMDQLSENFGSAGVHAVTATATDPHGVAVSCNTSATVTPADQATTFGPLPNATYGAADFALSATASSGLTVSYAASGSCSIAGTSSVHITGAGTCQITASQSGSSNYNAAPDVIQGFTISPAAVTATGGSGTAQYDTTIKTPSACSVTGAFTGDLTCSNQPASVGPDAGTTAIVPSVSGSDLGNFTVTPVSGSYVITQAPSNTTVSCPASVTYNGAAQTPCTATVTGVGGLSQSVAVTYTANQNAGIATANAIFSGDTDHSSSNGSATFTIAKAPLTVTAGSYTGTYDGNTHALTACVASTNFDGLTCANNPLGPVGPDAGSGAVFPMISGPVGNYNVTSNNGAWSISALAVAVSAGSYTGTYDGTAHAPTACTSTYAGVACANSPVSVGPGAGSGIVTPTVSVVSGVAADYIVSPQNGSWSIAKAPLTIAAGSYSGIYDGNTHALTACTVSANFDALTCSNSPVGPVGPDVGSGSVTPVIGGAVSNYTVTSNNGSWSISAMAVTVAAGSYNGTYDGTGHAPSACTSTFAGVACANSPASVGPGAGSGVVTPAVSVVSGVAADYIVSSQNGSWSIAKAPLTVTAGSYSGTYDGNTHALTACAVSTNFDALTCSNSPVGPVGPDVGSGSVTPVIGGAVSNYTVTSNNGSWSISAMAVTVTAGSYAATYDGNAHAPSACASTFAGVACTNSPPSVGPGVGSGVVTPSVSLVSGVAADYTVGLQNGSWSITQATSTVTVTCPVSVTYTGSAQTPCTAGATGSGGLSQALSVTYTSNTGVGTAAAAATFAGDANHTGNTNSATFKISPAPLTITWNPALTPITYGTALTAGSAPLNATVTGNVTGTFSYNAVPVGAGVAAAIGSGTVLPAGTYNLSVAFIPADSTDYTAPTVVTVGTLVVNQASPGTVSFLPNPNSVAYNTPLTAATLDATLAGADAGNGTITYSANGAPLAVGATPAAGTYSVTATFTPTGPTAGNFTTATATAQVVVTSIPAGTLSLANVTTSYGAGLTSAQLAARLSGADAGGQGTTGYSIAGATAGGQALSEPVTVGSIIPAGSYTLTATFTPGGAGCTTCSNFTAVSTTAKLTVSAVPLIITASSLSTVYGSPVPAIVPIYTTLVGGDTSASLTAPPVCQTTATSASNVANYPTICSGAVDPNYVISYTGGMLTVTRAVLTVAATPLSLAYGGYIGTSQLSYTINGFQLGQTVSTDLIGFPFETTDAPSNGTVGNYTITMSGGLLFLRSPYNADYTITYQSASLTISPAVITVTATSVSYVYGATDQDRCGHVANHLTYTISGLAYGQNQWSALFGSPSETTTATPTSGVGTYPITITKGMLSINPSLAADYTLAFVNGTVTVTPAQLTVVANSYSRPVNNANPAFGYTISGFVNADTQATALTGAASCCSTTATTTSPAGDYAIVIGPGTLAAAHGNYTISYVNGVLVIYNPNNHGDPHNNGYGGYCDNFNWDRNNWPDPYSFSFYWGSGRGPTIKQWGSY